MFKALFGSAALLIILVFAALAPAGDATAQQGAQTPGAAAPPAAVPAPAAAAAAEPSDDEIRQLLSKQSVDSWAEWKKNRGINSKKACSEYNDGQGPTKPSPVYCDPADVPADQIQQYRESQRQQKSTFVNEPRVKF